MVEHGQKRMVVTLTDKAVVAFASSMLSLPSLFASASG